MEETQAQRRVRIKRALRIFALALPVHNCRWIDDGLFACEFCTHKIKHGDRYRSASIGRAHEFCFQATLREYHPIIAQYHPKPASDPDEQSKLFVEAFAPLRKP